MQRICLTLALAALSAAPAFAQGELDVITLLEGAAKRGKIVEASTNKDSVAIEINTVVTQVEVSNIRRITYTDSPPLLRAAEVSIAAGQLEDAVDKLKQINAGDIQRDIVAAEVEFNKAYCMAKMALAGSGNVTAAAAGAAIKKFADDEKSYHYYQANEIMGDLASSLGNPAAAGFYARSLRPLGQTIKCGPRCSKGRRWCCKGRPKRPTRSLNPCSAPR
jgi:hypothetical protein